MFTLFLVEFTHGNFFGSENFFKKHEDDFDWEKVNQSQKYVSRGVEDQVPHH